MAVEQQTQGLATAADLANRPAGAPAEILGGELVPKTAPSPEHGSAQFALAGVLFPPFGSGRDGGGDGPRWWLMTEVEVEYEPHEVYRHDVVGWACSRHPQRPAGFPVRVRPDWVCEILSGSKASNDTVRKLRGLHRAGVPHYWLLDPERQTLTVLRWQTEGYLAVLNASSSELVRAEPFETLEIHLSEILGQA